MRRKLHRPIRPMLGRALAALLAVTIANPLWAAPGDITQVPAPSLGSDPPRSRDLSDGDASVSTQTGGFSYSYPIAVPPGRLGVQPSLALTYSSQGTNYGGIAAGWSLAIPEITLDTSQSIVRTKLAGGPLTEGPWVSSMAGGRPLVAVTETPIPGVRQTFRAKSDSTWARYERMEAGAAYRWRVRTTDGATLYFGESARAPLSTDLWAPLTRTEDAFGNTVEYTWEGWQLLQIRYTSNPGAGLPAFARVDFAWEDGFWCNNSPVGAQEDRRLNLTRGRMQLAKIRAVAFEPSNQTDVHTREITLSYEPDLAACGARRAPMRVLTSIQESAWGVNIPRVDLPPVTFDYNRFDRAFDATVVQNMGALWPEDPSPFNLGSGIRRQGSAWPSVESMLLDFNGDGLQDRIFVYPDDNECKFAWVRNRGRAEGPTGQMDFDLASAPQTLPRLPWRQGAVKDGSVEWCSLSAQYTMLTNKDVSGNVPCPATTGVTRRPC